MSLQRVAYRYAKAIIDLAVEQGKLETIHGDMQTFDSVYQNRDFQLLVQSPIVKADKKRSIFSAIFDGKVDEMTAKFFDIVINKGRETVLPMVVKSFMEQYKKIKHISSVKLRTAAPLNQATLDAIVKKLKGSDVLEENIEIQTVVDESLIGGFVIEFGDRLYDASVARKLETLKKEFSQNKFVRNF